MALAFPATVGRVDQLWTKGKLLQPPSLLQGHPLGSPCAESVCVVAFYQPASNTVGCNEEFIIFKKLVHKEALMQVS